MIERVNSFKNEYLSSLIEEYTDKRKAPESHGMAYAIRAYLASNDENLSELMVLDMPFMQDMDDFMGTIEAAGITEFLLCDKSTALMENLHYLMGHGWQIAGTCELSTTPFTTRQGLRLKKA
jgi:hypothetical protein